MESIEQAVREGRLGDLSRDSSHPPVDDTIPLEAVS